MLANANSPTDASSLDRNVREVVAICATHDLAHGEPNDLVTFMRALHEDKHLAMNFWSLVARLTDKGGPHPNQPDWILATIVEGVTGRSLEEVRAVGPAHRVLVSRLASMLAGEDVLAPIPEISNTPVAEPSKAPEEMIPVRQARQADIAEITPRQSRTSAALASVRKSREAPPIAPITNPAWLHEERLGEERLRLVLQPEQPLGTEEAQPLASPSLQEIPENDPHVVIPLSSYAERSQDSVLSGGRLAAGLIFLLLIAAGIWFAFNRNSPAVEKIEASLISGYESTIASLRGNKSQAVSNPAPNVPASETSGVATPPAAPVSTPTPAFTAPSRSARAAEPPQPEAVPAPAPVVRRPPSNEALVAAESNAADASLPDSTADRVVVPAATMQDSLISSRVPIFPEAAKANGIEGRVVLQAIVNKDGSVGHLHVISGDPALRRAATDAVSTWRYRPYLVNGQPVEVSTTISVDFFDSN